MVAYVGIFEPSLFLLLKMRLDTVLPLLFPLILYHLGILMKLRSRIRFLGLTNFRRLPIQKRHDTKLKLTCKM